MHNFYIEFLEECLRTGKYEIRLSRCMSSEEIDYHQSIFNELVTGKYDIDAEQRVDMDAINNSLKILENVVENAALLYSQLDKDMRYLEDAYRAFKHNEENVYSFFESWRARRMSRAWCRDLKLSLTLSGGLVGVCETNISRGFSKIKNVDLTHLKMISIALEKSIKIMAVRIYGENGSLIPDASESDIFHDLDLSKMFCSKLITLSEKITTFSSFVTHELSGYEKILSSLKETDRGGLAQRQISSEDVGRMHDVRNDVRALLAGVVGLDVVGLRTEFKLIKDYHSGKIVNSQIFG